MSQAKLNRSSLLTVAGLRALFDETTKSGSDPRTGVLAARSVLNLAYVAEEREMAAYHDDPMSACAPSEWARLLLRPWSQLRETIDARIDALEAELEAMESEWCSMAETV